MKNDIALGFVLGFVISVVGVAFWVTEPASDPIYAFAGWLLPATFVGGLALSANHQHRRLGAGIALGAVSVAGVGFVLLLMLVASIGS
jgi:hypothetical protein